MALRYDVPLSANLENGRMSDSMQMAPETYASFVVWHAPRRGLVWRGRDEVQAGLEREAAAMHAACLIRLRRASIRPLVLEEVIKQFDYLGDPLDQLSLPVGARVELLRLRVLTHVNRQIVAETSFETWSVLSHAGEI
jgi:hypothetical protein